MGDPEEQEGWHEDRLKRAEVLASVDGEIAFYRRRAGQVFFLGVSAEAVIFAGAGKIAVPTTWPLEGSIVYHFFFGAVAAVGIVLGLLYQRRIRFLKRMRDEVVGSAVFPPISKWQSEILVLCASLFLLSFVGILLARDGAFGPHEDAEAAGASDCRCDDG